MANMPEIRFTVTVDHKDDVWLRELIRTIVADELTNRTSDIELRVDSSSGDERIRELIKHDLSVAFAHFEREWRNGFDPSSQRKG